MKVSLINPSVIKNNLKRFWWGSLLYTVILMVLMPLRIVLTSESYTRYANNIASRDIVLDNSLNIFSMILSMVVPVIACALIFRFIQSKKEVVMTHALPITRLSMYFNSIVSLVALLFVPILLTGCVLFAMMPVEDISGLYLASSVFKWMGMMMFANLLVLSITSAIAMMTGSTIAQLILTYIFNFAPALITLAVSEVFRKLVFGYSTSNITENPFIKYLPFIKLADILNFTWLNYLAYSIVAVIFLVLGYLLYKYRKLETATDLMSYNFLKPVLKYFITFIFMLTVYSVMVNSTENIILTIIVTLVFTFIAYFGCEMLIKKSFKVFNTYKGLLGYIAIIIVLLLAVRFDVFGFERKVPDVSKIDKAFLSDNFNPYVINNNSIDNRVAYPPTEGSNYVTDKETIEDITKLHKKIISSKNTILNRDDEKVYPFQKHIVYVLDNGKIVVRKYIIYTDILKDELIPIYESKTFKEANNEIFKVEESSITRIQNISDNSSGKNSDNSKMTKDDAVEFAKVIKEDILNNLTYEDFDPFGPKVIFNYALEYSLPDPNIDGGTRSFQSHGYITPKYIKTVNWLKEKGYYDQIIVKPSDIEYLSIVKSEDREKYEKESITDGVPEFIKNGVKIHEKEKITEILNLKYNGSIGYNDLSSRYVVNMRDTNTIDDYRTGNYTIYYVKYNKSNGSFSYLVNYSKSDSNLPSYLPR